jgi:GxxExxY protein
MHENEIAKIAIDCAFKIHSALGPGLLESVYRAALAYELRKIGLRVAVERKIPAVYEDIELKLGFSADIVIENKVIIETKSIDALAPIHAKVLLTYLRMSKMKLGILINFRVEMLKFGLKRIVNNL